MMFAVIVYVSLGVTCCIVYCLKLYNSTCARHLDDFVYYYAMSLELILLFDLIEFDCDCFELMFGSL